MLTLFQVLRSFFQFLSLVFMTKLCQAIDSSRFKKRQLVYCLAEGCRQATADYLLGAESMSIHQDSRKARLAVRFRAAAGVSLDFRWGFLGARNLALAQDLSASGIRDGTLNIIADFAEPSDPPPHKVRMQRRQMPKLRAHILRTVELFNADGAADEQLAGNLLKQSFPNLVVVNRDRAHACRRLGRALARVTLIKHAIFVQTF